MINIQHLQYPFYHTIVYNFFERPILKSILHELKTLTKVHHKDPHHRSLLNKFSTEPFCLDNIYNDKREKSSILSATDIGTLRLHEYGKLNPFLYYLPLTNKDTTFIQRYRNDSSYESHDDRAVLTCLYLVKTKKYTGGDLIFSRYNYTPHLPHNSCLIFPSYETHQVSAISANTNDPVRYSINRRYYIEEKKA
tara:strand:+ start:511 stop:1092 length:582 start_codon:yes stop_codon:yes gene_type:complete